MKRNALSVLFIGVMCLLFSLQGYSKGKKNSFPSDIHVFLIGFDGWGSHSMVKADMPILREMMEKGSWTLKKRSVLPSSSAANWASMFMGASPELHGYTQWNSQKPEIPSRILGENNIFPTIFQLLHSQKEKAEIGLFFQWNGIKYVVDTLSINNVVHLPKPDKNGKFATIFKQVGEYIVNRKPTLCTVVYDYPDHYGHLNGFESDEYYQSLKEVDESLETIIQSVKDAGIFDKSVFIVTSDHGGIEKNHGGKTLAEMESPFVIFGCNIKHGYEIEESMMQYDIAATIAFILGLDVPQAWIGRPVKTLFEKIK